MQVLKDFDQTRFWKRLDHFSSDGSYSGDKESLDHLKASVRKVASRAKWINSQVCRYMPQYTLHEERHFLNVLGIMDALVPDDVIARLTPLECALPILAAYTHDLGMALAEEERDNLFDESKEQGKHFASYQTRFDEELRQLDRWGKRQDELQGKEDGESIKARADAEKRIDAINGHILSSYLRETHTEDASYGRLRNWLRKIRDDVGDERLYEYGQTNYERILALIGLSHGNGAPWLRRKLNEDSGRDDGFNRLVGIGEEANLAFAGLLLRLADIMDFDASRTPRILFKHFGIESDHSVLEWNKHLSVVGWKLGLDPAGQDLPMLRYEAECQHPVHEKCIREFATWIDAELGAVRTELESQTRHLTADRRGCYKIHLPAKTDLIIRAARDPKTDQPKYVYHDLQFRLDQNEIQQLLMGESLYGDPGLCIRELLQNALDALELRELRLKMKQKGEARASGDGQLISPGWVREPDGREEELRVTLDWGTDEETGQQWLRVTDNGVGMTKEVIKNYFTQIGKSYYRSLEFNQERAGMKVAGELVSPISIFGVGILSCFMIADRLFVRTRAAGRNDDDGVSTNIAISGPGSLFWLTQGTRNQQGTEVTLFLKPAFEFASQSSDHENQELSKASRSERNPRTIDPTRMAIATVIWPRHPVVVCQNGEQVIRIDDALHGEVLAPIDRDKVLQKAADWECPGHYVLEPYWNSWEWSDCEGSDATGTRVRIWFPCIRDSKSDSLLPIDSETNGLIRRQHDLAAFVEPQLDAKRRTRLLVRGMNVSNVKECKQFFNLHGIGCRVWLDLRGNASPELTVSRQKAYSPADHELWVQTVEKVLRKASASLQQQLSSRPAAAANLLCGAGFLRRYFDGSSNCDIPSHFDLVATCWPSWKDQNDELAVEFTAQRVRQYYSGKLQPSRLLDRAEFDRCRRMVAELAGSHHSSIGQEFVRAKLKHGKKELALQRDRELELGFWYKFEVIRQCVHAFIFQVGFPGDLSDSWPGFNLFRHRGTIANSTLAGPGIAEFFLQRDLQTLDFADPDGKTPAEVTRKGYGVTFPMPAVPLGQLRRECAEWRTERRYRQLGVAPFLLPALHDVWQKHADFFQAMFKVPHIYCLLPRLTLWSKRFSDWSDDDWNHPENLSALWDLSGHLTGTAGKVLWARGTHHIDEMPKVALPAPEFLEANS